jgi:hypothetical protein
MVIFVISALINAVNLGDGGQRRDLGYEPLPLVFVSLGVAFCSFFRVIFRAAFALCIPETLQLNAKSVSLFVLRDVRGSAPAIPTNAAYLLRVRTSPHRRSTVSLSQRLQR